MSAPASQIPLRLLCFYFAPFVVFSALSLYRRANNVSFRMLFDYLGNSCGPSHNARSG